MDNTQDSQPPTIPPFAASNGSATADERIIAFVQGAQWWEYQSRKATMWPSDRDLAEMEAKCRASKGTLGKSPNAKLTDAAT